MTPITVVPEQFRPIFDKLSEMGWLFPENPILGKYQLQHVMTGYSAMMITQPRPRFVIVNRTGNKVLASAQDPASANRIISHLKLVGIL